MTHLKFHGEHYSLHDQGKYIGRIYIGAGIRVVFYDQATIGQASVVLDTILDLLHSLNQHHGVCLHWLDFSTVDICSVPDDFR